MFTTNERIKVYRKRLGLSQEEIAAKMGMTHPPYLAREKGRRSWTLAELEKLSEIFGCTVKDLIEDHLDQNMQ